MRCRSGEASHLRSTDPPRSKPHRVDGTGHKWSTTLSGLGQVVIRRLCRTGRRTGAVRPGAGQSTDDPRRRIQWTSPSTDAWPDQGNRRPNLPRQLGQCLVHRRLATTVDGAGRHQRRQRWLRVGCCHRWPSLPRSTAARVSARTMLWRPRSTLNAFWASGCAQVIARCAAA